MQKSDGYFVKSLTIFNIGFLVFNLFLLSHQIEFINFTFCSNCLLSKFDIIALQPIKTNRKIRKTKPPPLIRLGGAGLIRGEFRGAHGRVRNDSAAGIENTTRHAGVGYALLRSKQSREN